MGQEKLTELIENIKLSSGQLRMKNQIKKMMSSFPGSTRVRVIREGLNKINSWIKISQVKMQKTIHFWEKLMSFYLN